MSEPLTSEDVAKMGSFLEDIAAPRYQVVWDARRLAADWRRLHVELAGLRQERAKLWAEGASVNAARRWARAWKAAAKAMDVRAYTLHAAQLERDLFQHQLDALKRLCRAWLDERDRYYQADKPGVPASELIRYCQKVDEAREALRRHLEGKGDG